MIKRIIDIAEQSYIHTKHQQLLIDKEGKTVGQIPIEDLGVLILQHPAIVISQATIVTCQKNNAVIIFCDEKHLPYSVILPVSDGHTLHQKVLRVQIEAKKTITKKIWKQVIQQKIMGQQRTLSLAGKDTALLPRLASKVKSGDVENHEAQAAQYYWPRLFEKSFRRDYQAAGVNALLNYGYAIMRAMVARAVVAGGLHPAIGIHHHNQYNALCLADDLMEPFRPWVDQLIHQIWMENEEAEIDKETKKSILGLLNQTVSMNKKKMPMMLACHYLIADFKRCLDGSLDRIKYPALVTNA